MDPCPYPHIVMIWLSTAAGRGFQIPVSMCVAVSAQLGLSNLTVLDDCSISSCTSSSRLLHSFYCSFSHAKGTQVKFRALPKGRASWLLNMLWPEIAIHERGSERNWSPDTHPDRPACAPSGLTTRNTTWILECSELYNTKNLHQELMELLTTTLEGIAYPLYRSHSDQPTETKQSEVNIGATIPWNPWGTVKMWQESQPQPNTYRGFRRSCAQS